MKEPIRTNFKQGINALIRLMINEEKGIKKNENRI